MSEKEREKEERENEKRKEKKRRKGKRDEEKRKGGKQKKGQKCRNKEVEAYWKNTKSIWKGKRIKQKENRCVKKKEIKKIEWKKQMERKKGK